MQENKKKQPSNRKLFGRLVKHEWRQTWKTATILLAILLLTSLASAAYILYTSKNAEFQSSHYFVQSFSYTCLLILPFQVMLHLCIHFNRSMYLPAGYLTHTLPVKAGSLLNAKLLITFIWITITSVTAIVSYLMLTFPTKNYSARNSASLSQMDQFLDAANNVTWEFFDYTKEIFQKLFVDKSFEVSNHVVSSLVLLPFLVWLVLLILFDFLLVIYTAMSIGQLANTHRNAAALLSGCSLLAALTVFLVGMDGRTGFSAYYADVHYRFSTHNEIYLFYNLGIFTVLFLLLYFSNLLIVKKHLNLQ